METATDSTERVHRHILTAALVPVPAGDHEVHLDFRPRTFRTGTALPVLSLLVLVSLAWHDRRRCGPAHHEGGSGGV